MAAIHLKEGQGCESEDILSSLVRFAVGVSRGVSLAGEEEGRKIVSRAVRAGKLPNRDGDWLINCLTGRLQQLSSQFESKVDGAVQEALRELSRLSSKELDHLRLKTEELERRVENLQGRG